MILLSVFSSFRSFVMMPQGWSSTRSCTHGWVHPQFLHCNHYHTQCDLSSSVPVKANIRSSWNEVAFPVPYISWDTKGGSIAERTFNYSCHNFIVTFINNFSWIFISINIWWLLFKAWGFCWHLSFNYFSPASLACPYTLDFINFSTY